MRPTNGFTKFYTNDLIVEDSDLSNALWGYHLANNMEHLLGLDGYLYFGATGDGALGYEGPRSAQVSLSKLELTHAPVIEMYAKPDCIVQFGTTRVIKEWDGFGWVVYDVEDRYIDIDIQYNGLLTSFVGQDIRIGHNQDEIMHVLGYYPMGNIGEDLYAQRLRVARAITPSTGADFYSAGERIYIVGSYNATTLAIPNVTFSLNPVWMEAIANRDYARFTWMHSSPGTLYYKIFGV
jgi:hypothetical protein